MRKVALSVSLLVAAASLTLQAQNPAPTKPKRINKAIELLEQGQPVYYTGSGDGSFEAGVRLAQTWADYILYEMEHEPFDMVALRNFMRGLVKGGPTKSGHRTPAVIVTLPVGGLDEATIRANYWMIQSVLDAGVHGIQLCHARSPEAIRLFVQAARYPYQKLGTGALLGEGLRGAGGQGFAAQIWGVSVSEYLKKADVWPINPDGEILLGLKIEDRHALVNAELSAMVPGVGFAEWGPGDMGMSFGFPEAHDAPYPPEMLQAYARVLAACKAAKIAFLSTVKLNDVEEEIRKGVMIGGSANQAIAEKGRRFTKRSMPW